MAICAILEAVGIGIVLPFTAALLDENFSNNYPFIQVVLDFFNINNKQKLVVYFLCFFVLVYFIKSLFTALTYWVQYSFLTYLEIHFKTKLFKKYMINSYNYFLNVNSAKIMRNIGSVPLFIENYITSIMTIIAEFLVIITIAFLLLYNAFQAGIFLIIFFALSIYFFHFFSKNKLKSWGTKLLEIENKNIKNLHESIYGIKVIKILGKEKFFIDLFEKFTKANSFIRRNVKFLAQLPKIWLELISVIGLSFLMILLIFENPDISHTFSILAIFVVAAFRLMPSANRLLNSFNQIKASMAPARLVIDELENVDSNPPLIDKNQSIAFDKSIKLENISFIYQNTPKNIIDGVNLTINRGACIGFVGKSGSGKSTLIDVVIGLLSPSSGVISIDDQIINTSSRAWQKNIGYVSQSVYLTDDTIKNNIAFGLHDKEIDKKSLDYSLKASQLDEFINTLPDQINTFVGEYGVRLSGGQRQRIALARALYINPPILVFDEATSSLDTKTEKEIMSSIKKLKGKKTILIIAHRLSTLEYCDEIYEVKESKVVKI